MNQNKEGLMPPGIAEELKKIRMIGNFAADTIEALQRDNERLREALQPFAEVAAVIKAADSTAIWSGDYIDAAGCANRLKITAADIRKAKAALSETPKLEK